MRISYLLSDHLINAANRGSTVGYPVVSTSLDEQTFKKKRIDHILFSKSRKYSFICIRLAACLLILCMLVSSFPIYVFAEISDDVDAGNSATVTDSQRETNANDSDPGEDAILLDPEEDSSSEADTDLQNINNNEERTDSYSFQDEDLPSAEGDTVESSSEGNTGSEAQKDDAQEQIDLVDEKSQPDITGDEQENAEYQTKEDSEQTASGSVTDQTSDQSSVQINTVQTEENQEIVANEAKEAKEEQQEILFEEELRLVQDGDFVTEHFGPLSERKNARTRSSTESLRNLISAAMEELQTEVSIADLGFTRTNDIDTVRSVYRSCIRGNRFYISGGFSYYVNNDDVITRIKIIYNSAYTDANGDPDGEIIKKALRTYDKRVIEALEYIEQGRDVLERILLAHDWIIRECDYDYENNLAQSVPFESYSAYGCMVNGIAVCNGYALAYSYLLEEMGYESYILSSDSMNHAWNLVRTNDGWMHVDVTWDDPVFSGKKTWLSLENGDYSDEGFVNHIYFLKNDEEIEHLGHYGWRLQNSEYDLPLSTATGLYDETVFFDLSGSALNYLNGCFFFSDDGVLTACDDLWGKNRRTVSIKANAAYYPHVFEEKLYYTDLQDIYCYSLNDGEILLLQGENQEVSELSIKSGELVYVLLDNNIPARYTLPVAKIHPPGTVQFTKFVPYDGKIKLVWELSEGADGYILSYAPMQESKFKTLKNITNSDTLSYSHKTSEAYVQYRIRAYKTQNGEKIYSDYSETITVGTLPGKVMNLAAMELASGKTKFTWDSLNDVDGYVLYESGDNGTTWKPIKTLGGDQGSYKVGLKTEDKVYRARAFRVLGEKKYYGSYSDPVKVYVKPEAPAELTVTHISEKKDRIDWTTSEGADGYILSRSSNGSSYTVLKTFTDGFTNSYVATLSEGFQYLYRICAYRLVDGIKVRSNATQGQ